MTIARNGGAHLVVDAPVDAVGPVVSDVTRTGEWSGECRQVTWRDGRAAPVPGARFRGRNRSGWRRWSRTCELTAVDPPHTITWRTLPSPLFRDSSEWQIALEPAGAGTLVRLSYRVTLLPRWLERILSVVGPDLADRTAGLTDALRRLGRLVAAEAAPGRR